LHSGLAVTGEGSTCQFRFRSDGGLDQLTVHVTVRNAFMEPVAACTTSVALTPGASTAFCSCDPITRGGFTDPNGVLLATFDRIGGRGTLDVCVTTHCIGHIALGCVPIEFTSADLDASCQAEPASAVSVVDLGLWAGGLPPAYAQASDYDCSGLVGVTDLAIWASGLGVGCPP
jgi:hypothetical protein